MCDPVTAAAAATIGAVTVSAGASVAEGIGNRRLASAQAAADDVQAREEMRSSYERAARIRMQGQKFLSEQRVQIAAGGTEVGSGSSLEVGMADAGEIELDAMTEIYGGTSRAKALKQQAGFRRAEGVASQAVGVMRGASDLIKAGASWASLGGGGGGASTSSSNAAGASSGGRSRSGGFG